jgi:predicted transposase YbfD/YdcC
VEKGHGRIETRALRALSVDSGEINFPFVSQIARIDRRRELKNKSTFETVFVVTSLSKEQADEQKLAALVRGHWGIENQLHYRRDWSFDEDRCRIRHPTGSRVMTTLRNLAIAWAAHQSRKSNKVRSNTLPQLQRRVSNSPNLAVAALTKPWT